MINTVGTGKKHEVDNFACEVNNDDRERRTTTTTTSFRRGPASETPSSASDPARPQYSRIPKRAVGKTRKTLRVGPTLEL